MSATQPTLLVLAAGMGSRYGGLKQIDPVGPHGEAILDYSVYDALRAGFGKVVFAIRRQIEQAFRETVGARFASRVDVDYVFQEIDRLPPGFAVPPGRTKPWGTTHAVLAAAGKINEPFAAINADDFYGAESYEGLAGHLLSRTGDCAMAGFVLSQTLSDHGAVARGLCRVGRDGYLEKIVEMTHIERATDAHGATILRNTDAAGQTTLLTGSEIVSMNMWAFTPAIFAPLRQEFERFLAHHGSEMKSESYLPNSIQALMERKQVRVRVLPTGGAWLGVTYREDRAAVVEGILNMTRDGRYPEKLWP